jgi:hypothetical protein
MQANSKKIIEDEAPFIPHYSRTLIASNFYQKGFIPILFACKVTKSFSERPILLCKNQAKCSKTPFLGALSDF